MLWRRMSSGSLSSPKLLPKPLLPPFANQVSTVTSYKPPPSHPLGVLPSPAGCPGLAFPQEEMLEELSRDRRAASGTSRVVCPSWRRGPSPTCRSVPSREGDPGQASSPDTAGSLQH